MNLFSFDQVQKKGAAWDEKKLHWLSGQHVQNKNSQFLLDQIRLLDSDWGKNSDISTLINIINSLKPRAKSLHEFIAKSKHFFIAPDIYDEAERLKAWPDSNATEIVGQCSDILTSLDTWSSEVL